MSYVHLWPPGKHTAQAGNQLSEPGLLQVVEGLRACHSTGIVHRDVKPQNVIVCGEEQCAKMIDLGAAADLRVGINYVPNEFLLDPRYAPPEQYIMSTQVRNTCCQKAPSLHGHFFGL